MTIKSRDHLTVTSDHCKIELHEADLNRVVGGMTNNQQTTAQKAAEKADSYLRA
jgi:hypothetical protein